MVATFFQPIVLLILVTIVYILSKHIIQNLFNVLHLFFESDTVIFTFISIIFLPGTVIHELAHYLTAIVLFLRVREFHILPQWEGNYIKLGRVVYEKKDVVRSILVGIAPIFFGLLLFWYMAYLNIFPQQSIILNIILAYFIFVISSSMFSSKQDLIDIVYIVPIGILLAGVCYVFNIDLGRVLQNKEFMQLLNSIFTRVNLYLLLSVIINVILLLALKLIIRLKRVKHYA